MNLVYICVFYNTKYIRLLELLLLSLRFYSTYSFDILILTSPDFQSNIQSLADRLDIPCKIHCIPCASIFEAACARLHIFDWPEITNYDKLLYLDTDILIRRDLTPLFSFELDDCLYGIPSGTVKSLHFGGEFFDFSTIDPSTPGMNSGTLLFPQSTAIRNLFSRMILHIKAYSSKPPYALDQPFINYHAFSSQMCNTTLLIPYISLYEDTLHVDNADTALICHFSYPIGNFEHKYARMSEFFKNLLTTTLRSTRIDIVGKRFSWGSGYIQFLVNHEGYYEVQTTWGKGSFTILDSQRVCAVWNNHYHVMQFNEAITEYMSIRTGPKDFDFITGSIQESFLNIYGDSHAMVSFRGLTLDHRNLFQFSKTMHRVGRDSEIIHFHPSHNNPKRIFCLAYGEVDVRGHVGKQVQLGRDYESVCKELVDAYFKTIQTLIKEYKAIIIVAISPPTAAEDHISCKIHTEAAGGPIPFVGTDADRVKYTVHMNHLLEESCKVYGFVYFNPYAPYIRDDGCLQYDLSDTCIHVGKNAHILAEFMNCVDAMK